MTSVLFFVVAMKRGLLQKAVTQKACQTPQNGSDADMGGSETAVNCIAACEGFNLLPEYNSMSDSEESTPPSLNSPVPQRRSAATVTQDSHGLYEDTKPTPCNSSAPKTATEKWNSMSDIHKSRSPSADAHYQYKVDLIKKVSLLITRPDNLHGKLTVQKIKKKKLQQISHTIKSPTKKVSCKNDKQRNGSQKLSKFLASQEHNFQLPVDDYVSLLWEFAHTYMKRKESDNCNRMEVLSNEVFDRRRLLVKEKNLYGKKYKYALITYICTVMSTLRYLCYSKKIYEHAKSLEEKVGYLATNKLKNPQRWMTNSIYHLKQIDLKYYPQYQKFMPDIHELMDRCKRMKRCSDRVLDDISPSKRSERTKRLHISEHQQAEHLSKMEQRYHNSEGQHSTEMGKGRQRSVSPIKKINDADFGIAAHVCANTFSDEQHRCLSQVKKSKVDDYRTQAYQNNFYGLSKHIRSMDDPPEFSKERSRSRERSNDRDCSRSRTAEKLPFYYIGRGFRKRGHREARGTKSVSRKQWHKENRSGTQGFHNRVMHYSGPQVGKGQGASKLAQGHKPCGRYSSCGTRWKHCAYEGEEDTEQVQQEQFYDGGFDGFSNPTAVVSDTDEDWSSSQGYDKEQVEQSLRNNKDGCGGDDICITNSLSEHCQIDGASCNRTSDPISISGRKHLLLEREHGSKNSYSPVSPTPVSGDEADDLAPQICSPDLPTHTVSDEEEGKERSQPSSPVLSTRCGDDEEEDGEMKELAQPYSPVSPTHSDREGEEGEIKQLARPYSPVSPTHSDGEEDRSLQLNSLEYQADIPTQCEDSEVRQAQEGDSKWKPLLALSDKDGGDSISIEHDVRGKSGNRIKIKLNRGVLKIVSLTETVSNMTRPSSPPSPPQPSHPESGMEGLPETVLPPQPDGEPHCPLVKSPPLSTPCLPPGMGSGPLPKPLCVNVRSPYRGGGGLLYRTPGPMLECHS